MNKSSSSLLHIVIALAAVINLAAVLLFGYGLPVKVPAEQAAERAAAKRAAENMSAGGADIISPGETTEEASAGTEEAPGASSPSAESSASSASESSASGTEAESGTYSGPVITLSGTIPGLKLSELPDSVRICRDLGLLSADDGHGNDISGQITVSYTASDDTLSDFLLTFSVLNREGDTAEETAAVSIIERDQPYLELTEERAVLRTGDAFRFMEYVRIAKDTDGSNLFDNIELSDSISTAAAGTYTLTYTVRGRAAGGIATADLVVEVTP